MAIKYLYSGATGTGDGSTWANAFTNITAATAGMSNGDTCFVANDHAESASSNFTITPPGTFANPCKFICVRRVGGSVPPVSADLTNTAVISISNNSQFSIGGGAAYWYGITFAAGSAGSSLTINSGTAASWHYFDSCFLALAGTQNSRIRFGSASSSPGSTAKCYLKNTTLAFSNVNQGVIMFNCYLEWFGGGTVSGTIPTALFTQDTYAQFLHIHGVDLSPFGTGQTIFSTFTSPQRVILERCKLGANVGITAAQTTPGATIDVVNCDSTATQYRNERYSAAGILTTETVVVMSGGASDGVTPFSHKMVTFSTANFMNPLESFPMGEFYAGATGSPISQTFELLTDNIALTNANCWVELEYLGNSGYPLASVASSGLADILASSSSLATSTATWTTTGVTTPTPQKIVMTFTPRLVGVYRAILKIAKPSTTVWLSPPAQAAA